jgi:predicted RNA-binding Zn-ribbon protein involved in translation (DUF1610 family)
MQAATRAALLVLAKSKDPRTLLSKMRPTSIAYHTAWAAVTAYQAEIDTPGSHKIPVPPLVWVNICPQCGQADLAPHGNGSKWTCPACGYIQPCCDPA